MIISFVDQQLIEENILNIKDVDLVIQTLNLWKIMRLIDYTIGKNQDIHIQVMEYKKNKLNMSIH